MKLTPGSISYAALYALPQLYEIDSISNSQPLLRGPILVSFTLKEETKQNTKKTHENYEINALMHLL